MSTAIQWTDETWNPTTGCTRVSEGCRNCYIERTPAFRMAGRKFVNGKTGVLLHPDRLDQPLHWKKPRRVFVNSLSDLFHEDIPHDFIYSVFITMARCQSHTFQVLTKRPDRMLDFCLRIRYIDPGFNGFNYGMCSYWPNDPVKYPYNSRPLPNVWLGVSVEDQQTADERIPLLLQTPAAVRFVSAEPLLGPVDLRFLQPGDPPTEINALAGTHGVLRPHGGTCAHLDWVIVGGESGPKARPCDLAWIRSIKDQCQAAGVPVFIKQIGSQPRGWCAAIPYGDEPESSYERDYCDLYEASEIPEPCSGRCGCLVDRKGGDMAEWPADLRVREFPTVVREG